MEYEAIKEGASLKARTLMLEYKGTHILVTALCLGSLIFLSVLAVYLVLILHFWQYCWSY